MSDRTDKWRAASQAARKSEHHWQADCLAEAADVLDGMADWRPPARADETAQQALTELLFWQLDGEAESWDIAGAVIAEGWRPPVSDSERERVTRLQRAHLPIRVTGVDGRLAVTCSCKREISGEVPTGDLTDLAAAAYLMAPHWAEVAR